MKHNYNLKKLLGIIAFIVTLSSVSAQSPGGVPASAWYKADSQNTVFSDAGVTNATDNASVQQWNEYFGTGHNLTQTSSGSQPIFSNATTLVNFNPTLTFNLDYLEYQPGTGVNIIDRTEGTLYAAGYFNAVGAAGIMGFDASMDYPGLHTSNNGLDNVLFYTGGPGYQGLSSNSFSDGNYFITGANWENGAGASAAYASSIVSLNGVRSSYNNTELQNAVINDASRDIRVGRDSNWGGMNGQINEVIIFDTALTMVEMDRVESYLAIKYGNTYAQGGGDYVNAAGVAVWTADATYSENIFGIARDDASELYQKQSRSTNQNEQLIIGAGSNGLSNTNADNTNTLTDGQFLIVGDNGLEQSLTTPLSYTGGSNGEVNFRFESIWKVQNTNGVGDITVAWPVGIDNLYVVQSGDETFDASDNFIAMDNPIVTINGVDYNTATVTLVDGQYFTFAGFQYAPGGVTSAAWYRADAVNTLFSDAGSTVVTDAATIQQWNEFNNKPFPLSQTNATYRPEFSNATTLVNFNPTATYTGGQKWLQYDPVDSDGYIIDRSQGALFSAGNTTNPAVFFGFGASGAGNAVDDPGLYRFTADKFLFYPVIGEYEPVSTYPINGPYIGGGTWENGAGVSGNNYVDITLDGYHETYDTGISNVNLATSRNTLMIGKADAGSQLDGQQNEMIVFGNRLTDEEVNRVESYLAIKYGQTLSKEQNRNYLSSTSTVVWDGTDANYYNNVFGIARDEISALHQKQSHSVNDSQKLIIGNGSSLFDTNAANTNNLNDGEFLLVGDNGLAQSLTTPLAYTGGTNGDTNFRFESIWKVQNTNGVGQVTIAWPAGIDNLYVVQSTDETFDATDNFVAMTGTATINGVDYNTATVTFNDGDFFTFAGYQFAPGGVVADLRIWLKADQGFLPDNWMDHSGTDNNYTQTNASRQPDWVTGSQQTNFNPTVDFGGAGADARFMVVPDGKPYTTDGMDNSMFLTIRKKEETTAFRDYLGFGNTTTGTGLVNANNPVFCNYAANAMRLYPYLRATPDQVFEANGSHHLVDVSYTVGIAPIKYGLNGLNGERNDDVTAGNSQTASGSILGSQPEIADALMQEVIGYERDLTPLEKQRVRSYLGIKYGITLKEVSETFDYLDSQGDEVWFGTTINSTYHNNVLGIAHDKPSALHQKQSTSINSGQKLVIGHGSSLFDTNAANTNDLTDGQFLMVGDNGLKQSLATPLTYTGGSNGETNFHFESIWKVQNTNGVGMVTIAWPVGVSNLYVVQSTDETFDATDNFTEMTGTATINGVDYNTTSITLADGEYFTFAGYGYAPAGVVNSLSYWYRADKNATNTGVGTDVTSWTDFFSGTVSTQLGTSPLPDYVEGDASYFNFNPGVNFTATTEKIGNIDVQTLSALEFDIFTFTKEGMSGTRFFNVGRDNTTLSGTNWDGPGLYDNGNIASRNNTGGGLVIDNPGNINFDGTIPSIMYHTFSDTEMSKGLNGDVNGAVRTYSSRGQMVGGHIFGANSGSGTGGDDAGFVGDIGETIIYGAGTLSTEERRRVDSYLAIKYGITLSRVDTDHYLGSTASATSIIWNGADNTTYNNNIFGMARSDIGGFEQKVSKSVNTGTILTVATDDEYTLSNLGASRTSFTNDEAYILFGDNEATGETSLATDPCTGEPLNPAVSTTNRVWRVENTNTSDAVWLQTDLNAYTFNTDIEIWIADDEAFTTNLVRLPAASYEAGTATFNVLFPEGVKYIKFAGVVTPSQCDVCTGGSFVFKTGRSWNTLAERTNNVIDSETTGTTDQGDLIVDMDVADPANVEYGPNSTPRPYGRWMISRRYDNQNVALTHTINLNQAVASASFQISNINTYLNNANRFTVEGYDCDGNLVLPKITEAIENSTATTYEIQGNEVVGTKPYRGLVSLYSTANVRFDRVIQSIVIIQEVDRTNTRNTLRSLNIGDISFECAVPLPPTEDNVTMVQDFTQSEDVPTCLETTMRMRLVNSNCDTRTVNISQTLPVGLEFVDDTYNDSEFTTPPAYTYNANTFTLNGLELPSGTSYLYINVRSTAGTTTTYNTSSSFTVQETGNPYNSIDPAGNADSQVSFEASNYTAPNIDLLYSVDATCLTEGDQVTYTLNFDNQEASAITGATLKVYYALGQEISSVTLNNGITGVHGFGPAGESYIEMTNVTIPTGTSSIDVLMDITSDIFTDEPTASSVFQLITEPGNACTEESPVLSNVVELGACEFCTQPRATGTPTEFTKIGISDRDGAVGAWPGNVPNGFIAIQSSDSGFVITRLTTAQINALDAVEGMLVYDTDEQCIKLYNGTVWKCIERSCNE